MPRPATLPVWATGSASIVEPTLAQKRAGWEPGTKPPAQWWNWWMYTVFECIAWLWAQPDYIGTVDSTTTNTFTANRNAGICVMPFATRVIRVNNNLCTENSLVFASAYSSDDLTTNTGARFIDAIHVTNGYFQIRLNTEVGEIFGARIAWRVVALEAP